MARVRYLLLALYHDRDTRKMSFAKSIPVTYLNYLQTETFLDLELAVRHHNRLHVTLAHISM